MILSSMAGFYEWIGIQTECESRCLMKAEGCADLDEMQVGVVGWSNCIGTREKLAPVCVFVLVSLLPQRQVQLFEESSQIALCQACTSNLFMNFHSNSVRLEPIHNISTFQTMSTLSPR